jgi:hypothetical protein
MDGIEHDHPFGYFGRILAEFATFFIAAPDFENRVHNEIIAG